MCGVAGVLEARNAAERERVVRDMLDALAHRGPDDEGVWSDEAAGLTLGHRRLAIIDTSPAGHEPMSYRGRYVLTFNGEIYNFLELREELEAKGHAFASRTDAEVLLAGYAEWGVDVLQRLVGMFAFAIWDPAERVLFLARDRAGEKPLYYAAAGKRFAFASELAALARCPWVDTAADRTALAQYLLYGYVPSPRTAYVGASKLPPAHYLLYDGAKVVIERYWDPVDHALAPRLEVSEAQAVDALEELLTRAVRQQSIADVPLGAFLSGGVDSSTIVALMARAGGEIKTFTVGFEESGYDESERARDVARHLGTSHVTERLSLRGALELATQLTASFGEPFGDPSALPTRLVAGVARRHVTVSLSGDGGDELFGGYAVYERLMRLERTVALARPFASTVLPALTRLPGKPGRQARRLQRYAGDGVGVGYRHYFTPDEVRRMTGVTDLGETAAEATWRALEGATPLLRWRVTDVSSYLPEDVLTKVDRAAMAVSLETRAPFLDHRVMEWALRLPDPLVKGKRVLKSLLHRLVPRELVDRPKHGFSVPVSTWLREDLREALQDELTPDGLAAIGIGDAGPVRTMLREHLSGRADFGRWLWLLYSLRSWHAGQRERRELVA
ncbi:MAG TPA: asparagine synthase (glutamine-hydrolyzing) [Trueperaceae bacterium]|nr:asparagine synthase (glutamine-hydrolyzing) [Trueperaceae bacterium]